MKQRAVIVYDQTGVESHASGIKTLTVEQKQCKSKVNE